MAQSSEEISQAVGGILFETKVGESKQPVQDDAAADASNDAHKRRKVERRDLRVLRPDEGNSEAAPTMAAAEAKTEASATGNHIATTTTKKKKKHKKEEPIEEPEEDEDARVSVAIPSCPSSVQLVIAACQREREKLRANAPFLTVKPSAWTVSKVAEFVAAGSDIKVRENCSGYIVRPRRSTL
jgi:hypothetical protein